MMWSARQEDILITSFVLPPSMMWLPIAMLKASCRETAPETLKTLGISDIGSEKNMEIPVPLLLHSFRTSVTHLCPLERRMKTPTQLGTKPKMTWFNKSSSLNKHAFSYNTSYQCLSINIWYTWKLKLGGWEGGSHPELRNKSTRIVNIHIAS